MNPSGDDDPKLPAKQPVVRGARACTVCRQAKMKCVGAEDGQKQCQRCKRSGADCIFEKHRRGRKPGSKLSEASKMLRKLEKGLNNAKLKNQAAQVSQPTPYPISNSRTVSPGDGQFRIGDHFSNFQPGQPGVHHFGGSDLPPLQVPGYTNGSSSSAYHGRNVHGSRSMDIDDDDEEDDDDDDPERNAEEMWPAKLIGKEKQRNSFFGTVLGPSGSSSTSGNRPAAGSWAQSDRCPPHPLGGLHQIYSPSMQSNIPDPITTGIMNEDTAKMLFDLLFLRLNPFINLFDPVLHSVEYVRKKCPFLFTTILMAGSKFWKPDLYRQCYKLANELAVRAFTESWKRVEVVQAFACLTYWREPDDTRTWTYIGYACRMAVELGLNRYVARPSEHETDLQRLERRNNERTYLVLFVHDRSLSMQTGRHWMLPEDELVRHSSSWHEQVQPEAAIRPEDVVLSAFVAIRKIAGETTDLFNLHKGTPSSPSDTDANYEVLLRGCNAKLTQWQGTWEHEMKRANGNMFHFSFLQFFCLYVRLFLNSFGIQACLASPSRASPSLQALTTCYGSAIEGLRIVTTQFAPVGTLQYAQDSITMMTAYSSVFLLRLLRSSSTSIHLHEGATTEIYTLITRTAGAYQDAATMASSSSSSAYHARFLRSLVAKDKETKARLAEKERRENVAIDPVLQDEQSSHTKYRPSSSRPGNHSVSGSGLTLSNGHTPPQMYPPGSASSVEHSFQFPASPHLPSHPMAPEGGTSVDVMRSGNMYSANMVPFSHVMPPASELDAHYWRSMFRELGFGQGVEPTLAGETEYSMYSPSTEPSYV